MYNVVWYDCPRCGRENSSDGEHFCGSCEQDYQQAEADRLAYEEELRAEKMRRGWIRTTDKAPAKGTSEQVEVLKFDEDGDFLKIKRQSGLVEWIKVDWYEPAYTPGGGWIIKISSDHSKAV